MPLHIPRMAMKRYTVSNDEPTSPRMWVGCGTVQLWRNRSGCSSKSWVFFFFFMTRKFHSWVHKEINTRVLVTLLLLWRNIPRKATLGREGLSGFAVWGDTVHCGKKAWMQECDASLPSMEQWITFHPHTGSSKTRFSIKVPPSKGSITSPKSVTNWEPSIQICEPTGELYFLDHSHTNPHQNFIPMFTADSLQHKSEK